MNNCDEKFIQALSKEFHAFATAQTSLAMHYFRHKVSGDEFAEFTMLSEQNALELLGKVVCLRDQAYVSQDLALVSLLTEKKKPQQVKKEPALQTPPVATTKPLADMCDEAYSKSLKFRSDTPSEEYNIQVVYTDYDTKEKKSVWFKDMATAKSWSLLCEGHIVDKDDPDSTL